MDQALIGLMLMGNGNYKGQQILSAKWLAMMQKSCDVAPYYGYLIWLNNDGALFKDAPRSSWFAIGAGSDVALHAADVTLMRSDMLSAVDAVRLSRVTFRKIKQNLFFAFFYNVLGIPLAAAGLLNPVIAGAAMAMSSVSVVSNSLLLKRWRPQHGKR